VTRADTPGRGEVLITRLYDRENDTYRVRIDRADPQAYIAPEMVDELMLDKHAPWATISGDRIDVIVFADDFGKRYIYRLGKYDELQDAFEMEWPD